MKLKTVLGLILLGAALWCSSIGLRFAQRIATGCACVGVTIGVLAILEYLLEWNPELDQWIFKDSLDPGSGAYLRRIGFNTASCFVLFGVALLLKREAADTNDHWREGLTLGGLFIAFIALLGDS